MSEYKKIEDSILKVLRTEKRFLAEELVMRVRESSGEEFLSEVAILEDMWRLIEQRKIVLTPERCLELVKS